MVTSVGSVACARAPNERSVEAEWLAPKALVRRGGELVPFYDPENPPILAVTSSLGIAARWEDGGPLAITRTERRGARVLVWTKLPPGPTNTLQLGDRRMPIGVWPVFNQLPEIAALPAEAGPRREQLTRLIADPQPSLALALAANMELARSYQRENDGPRARAAWLSMAEAAERAEVPSLLTHGLRSAAYVAYFVERDFAAVEPLLTRAEAIDGASGFGAGPVRALLLRAALAQQRGRLREASAGFEEGAKRAWRLGLDRDAALHLKALGPLLQDQGLHRRALEILAEVEPTFMASADPRDRVWFLNDLTWVLVRGQAAKAIDEDPQRILRAAREGIALATQLGATEEVAQLRSHLAWLALLEGRRADARAEIDKAQAAHLVSTGFASRFLMLLEARLLLEEGRPQDADQLAARLEQATRREAEGRASDLVWRALELRALAHAVRGRHAEATELYRQALLALEEVSGGVGLLEARGPYFADRRSLLENATRHAIDRGAIDRAFEVEDQYQSALYRALERSAHREGLDAQTQTELNGLRDAYRQKRAEESALILEAEIASAPRLRGLKPALEEARAELLKLASAIAQKEQLPAWTTATVPALRAKLRPDEGILTVGAGDDRAVHLLDRRGVHLVSAEDQAPLPIGPDLRHLYVVGASPSASRWVAAAKDRAGAPLIEGRTIAYLPYAGALLAKRPAPQLTRPALVVADPEGDLPGARAEGLRIAAHFPGATLLAGKEATRARVLEALQGQRLFHFAGHGALDRPWHAHLRVADDRLDAVDVLVERPAVGLVVLSGCETGVVQSLGTTQAIALPELWWLAGAQAVLASDRPIGDAEARGFMDTFYAHDGAQNPVAAYQAAARAMIARGDQSWQAFRVVGLR